MEGACTSINKIQRTENQQGSSKIVYLALGLYAAADFHRYTKENE
jgi:hypothetical protein